MMSFGNNFRRLLLRWLVMAIVLLVLAWVIPQVIEHYTPRFSNERQPMPKLNHPLGEWGSRHVNYLPDYK